jgi:hypothetical protein
MADAQYASAIASGCHAIDDDILSADKSCHAAMTVL